MKKFFQEFKAFISKGNVFDMAVGLIIATAFNKIVSSLVNDILMPLITYATGAASLADLSIVLRRDAVTGEATLTWAYGNFIQTIIDFLIIAFSVFLMVKVVNASRKKFKEFEEFAITQSSKEYKEERKKIKKLAKEQNRPLKEVWAEYQQQKAEKLAEEKRLVEEQKALEEANKPKIETTDEILKDIRELLKKNDNK